MPGILWEPTDQGESSEKEEAWKLRESEVMVTPLYVPDTSVCKTLPFLGYTQFTGEKGGLEATHEEVASRNLTQPQLRVSFPTPQQPAP